MSFLDKLEQSTAQEAVALLSQRFSQNREFFQKNLPNLLTFIDAPLKEYELNLSTNGINIVHKTSGNFIYPIENGKSSIFNFSKSIATSPANSKFWVKHVNESLIEENQIHRVPITGKATTGIQEVAINNKEYERTLIQYSGAKQLPTTILFGILGGLHLEYMLDRFENIHGLLLYEPNPDLFVLSTYFLDYQKLYQKCNEHSCYIFISGKISPSAVKDFFGTRLITNAYFRLEHNAYEHPFIQDAQYVVNESAKTSTRGWGTYEDEIVGLKNKLGWLDPKKPKYPFLKKSTSLNAPICVVGNGPSLNDSLEFLKANQDKFIILSAGTSLAPLKQNGIEPDFHIEIERMDHVKEWLENAGLGDTPLLAADIVHESTLECSSETFMFIRSDTASEMVYNPKFTLNLANPIVGNAAFALALNFSKEVYLFGMDMGFKDDGKQHAKGSLYDKMDDRSKEMLPTRGNFSKNIYTNSLFSLSKVSMEQLLSKTKANVYNVSDGVYIEGTTPKPMEEISLDDIDKREIKRKIKSCFTTKDFFRSTKNEYKEILEKYKKDLITVLKAAKIQDKRDLFQAMDIAYYATTVQRRMEPVTGTLMSGTFWHILNSIFTNLLRVNTDDVDSLYQEMITLTEKNLEDFVIE